MPFSIGRYCVIVVSIFFQGCVCSLVVTDKKKMCQARYQARGSLI